MFPLSPFKLISFGLHVLDLDLNTLAEGRGVLTILSWQYVHCQCKFNQGYHCYTNNRKYPPCKLPLVFDECLKKGLTYPSHRDSIGLSQNVKVGVVVYLHTPIELYAEANYYHFWANNIFLFSKGLQCEFVKKKNTTR